MACLWASHTMWYKTMPYETVHYHTIAYRTIQWTIIAYNTTVTPNIRNYIGKHEHSLWNLHLTYTFCITILIDTYLYVIYKHISILWYFFNYSKLTVPLWLWSCPPFCMGSFSPEGSRDPSADAWPNRLPWPTRHSGEWPNRDPFNDKNWKWKSAAASSSSSSSSSSAAAAAAISL